MNTQSFVTVQGVRAPALGFGTWELRGDACEEAVADALALGYRHLDTARMYENEAEVGRGMRASGVPRDEIFLTTKIWPDDFAAPRARKAAEACLRRLDADYIDLLLMHWPSRDVPHRETLEALVPFVERGLVRHLGVSNFPPAQVREAVEITPILTNQIEYHPHKNQTAQLALAEELDLMITAYCPLARGAVLREPAVRSIADQHGKSPAQVVLRWLIQQPKVSAIPKAGRREHRRANFDIWDFELTGAEMEQLSSLAQDS